MTGPPRLLVLDDYEGRIAGSPGMARLRQLADVTVLDQPLAQADLAALGGVQVLMAIRERTRLHGDLFDQLPEVELVLQTGGHAYHVDEPAVTRRGIVVALGRRAQMPSAAVPELTFGLMIAVLRRIHPLALLAVLDGAKALAKGVRQVFDQPLVQRCQVHKLSVNRPWGALVQRAA